MNNETVKREPHGGKLINLLGYQELLSKPNVKSASSLQLNERQVCDLELLLIGGFSPLEGFMTENQYDSVVHKYRLPSGHLFGIPVTLDTDEEYIKVGDYVKLESDKFGGLLGVLKVESKWVPDRKVEAKEVYKFVDEEHPAVYHLLHEKKKYNIGGKLYGVKLPERDWVTCKTPLQLREEFEGKLSVAFQCRNPIHRAHAAMFVQVSQNYNAKVVVHPIVGPTKSDDFSGFVRHKTYEILRPILPDVAFEYLPYNMMVGGV